MPIPAIAENRYSFVWKRLVRQAYPAYTILLVVPYFPSREFVFNTALY